MPIQFVEAYHRNCERCPLIASEIQLQSQADNVNKYFPPLKIKCPPLSEQLQERLGGDTLSIGIFNFHDCSDVLVLHFSTNVGQKLTKLLFANDAISVRICGLDDIFLHPAEERITVVVIVVLLEYVLERVSYFLRAEDASADGKSMAR